MIKSIENHNLENLLNPLANVTNFGSLFCRIRYCWDLSVEHSHGLKMSSHQPFSLNASPLSWTQYDSCHAELRRWVFSTASITRVTLVWSSWCCDPCMAYIFVYFGGLQAPLTANLLVCGIALHAWRWAALPPAMCKSARISSYTDWLWAVCVRQNC